VGLVDAEVVEDGDNVLALLYQLVFRGVVGFVGLTVAAGVDQDAAVGVLEGIDVARGAPAGELAAEAVLEDEGFAVAFDFVVDADAVVRGGRQGTPPWITGVIARCWSRR
jgi:hypothetical protein